MEYLEDSDTDVSGREFLRYFLGLEQYGAVSLDDLTREMPYSKGDITDKLEYLEDQNYLESSHGDIKPEETKGFNDILDETCLDPVDSEKYVLTDKGRNYLDETGLGKLESSLKSLWE